MPWATRYNPRGIQTRGLSVINRGNSPKSSLYFSLRIRHWVKQYTRRPLRKCEMLLVNRPGGDIKKGGCLISPLLLVFMWFPYCWFSHDVTKVQTTKPSVLLRFYFHEVFEQLKTNFHTNFCFKRVLGFVIEYAWISKLLHDVTFTWRPRELSCRLKKWRILGNFAI